MGTWSAVGGGKSWGWGVQETLEREREHVTFPSVRDTASLRRRLDSDERNRIWQIRDGLILKFSQMYY